jgi:hypothetical protein
MFCCVILLLHISESLYIIYKGATTRRYPYNNIYFHIITDTLHIRLKNILKREKFSQI